MPMREHLSPLGQKYGFTERMIETVRSKMRRMGIIDHVSRFNKAHGYREGWLFSGRFSHALLRMVDLILDFRDRKDGHQEQKDRDLFRYITVQEPGWSHINLFLDNS